MNEKLLLVTNTQGMLMISLKTQLEQAGYEVQVTKSAMKELSAAQMDVESIILYLDEDMSVDQQALVYMKDHALENDLSFILIGDQTEIDDVKKVIPASTIGQTYVRPINLNEASADMAEYLKAHSKASKKKILVVDDSGAMLRNVKGWLEDHYQVILANSGAMAIKYMTLNRPDLVLLDYEMPVVDGRQVLEMIRSEMDFSDVPVIFLTSKNDKESVANVVKLKPEGYLLKTMKPAEIIQAVDDFFEKQKSKQV